MTNNTWPTSLNDLDIQIPWTGTVKLNTNDEQTDVRSNEEWSVGLYNHIPSGVHGVFVERLSGSYAGGGFWLWKIYSVDEMTENILCGERHTGRITFKKKEGNYCNMFGGTKDRRGGWIQYFKLS